jgi:hypothetical protein
MKRFNLKWMAVLATALTIAFASCGDGGEEDDAAGMQQQQPVYIGSECLGDHGC